MTLYDPAMLPGGPLTDLLAELRRTRQEHVLAGRFRVRPGSEKDGGWFPTSTKSLEYESFRELLGSEAVRTALPELRVPDPFPVSGPPEFPASWWGTLALDGELAATLWHGGAYHRFDGSAAEAKQLASSALYELMQDRHEDFRVFYSDEAWTPWFLDIAWDRTWLLIDDARLEATLICLTDSD